ncbi:MAG TPA: hypothetical protein PKN08_09090, partial [Opitutaceae bacterium]|nr:hypothetical protein [Opitutaceae bacterium]
AQLGGVREAVPVRWVRLDQPGAAHGIVATDLMAFARNAAGRVVAGDLAAAVREAEAGRAAIVSDSFASLRRLRLAAACPTSRPARARRGVRRRS